MSFSCTLHPVDPRIAKALIDGVKGNKTNWGVLNRLRERKQLINRVNQPFKDGLAELLADCPDFNLELHLWGRPFFIHADQVEAIIGKIDRLYGMNRETEVLDFFLAELREFSEEAYLKRKRFKYPVVKELSLGLNPALAKMQAFLKHRHYKELTADLGFVLAQLLGVAYPYWYLGGYTLSFMADLQIPGWTETVPGVAGLFGEIEEVIPFHNRSLERNLSSGMYLTPEEVGELIPLLEREKSFILYRMAEKQVSGRTAELILQKAGEALSYAKEYRFGLLEASDIHEKSPKRYP
jgi:hypothetical protein